MRNTIELKKIIIGDMIDENWFGSGEVIFNVNGKECVVIVHEGGELDFDFDEELSDEELSDLMEAFYSSDKVKQAFTLSEEEF